MLNLIGECHSLSYDALTAHVAIVFARYMLLALEQRQNEDQGLGFLLLIFLVLTGKTVLPRWMFLLSPGILYLLKPAVGRLPKGIRIIVSGGWTNLISVIYYAAVLIRW